MLKSIYPTELVYLIGKNLEFDHENEQEGVFFVGPKGKETRANRTVAASGPALSGRADACLRQLDRSSARHAR